MAGEEFRVVIEKFADQGRCVTHIDGRTVFVRFALPGEEVLISIDRPARKEARYFAKGQVAADISSAAVIFKPDDLIGESAGQ